MHKLSFFPSGSRRKMMIRVTSKVVARSVTHRRLTELPVVRHIARRTEKSLLNDPKLIQRRRRHCCSSRAREREGGGMKGDGGSGCSLANNAALCGNREDSDKGKKEGREE